MSPRMGKREDIMSADISFDLERLFDPYNFDHIPKEKRLSLFKQRDLPHIKHYKAAVKIFGGPPRRTRAIIAPPMETPLKHRLGLYLNQSEPPPPLVLNGPLKPPPEPVKELTIEEKQQIAVEEKTSSYKSWVHERQKLRKDLNGLALTEAMLARKTDKTELEKRVESKFKAEREWKPESPPPREVTPPPKAAPDVPVMNIPPPDGLQILDKFLSLNRMRLIDLFKITDKDKSWSLSRTEFLNAVSQSAIPISEGEVDDMFIALDVNLDEELNFQELNKGLMQWRRQRRGLKKNSLDEESQRTSGQASSSTRLHTGNTTKPSSQQDGKSSKISADGKSQKLSQDGKSSRVSQKGDKSSDILHGRNSSKESSKETGEKPISQSLSRQDTGLSKASESSHHTQGQAESIQSKGSLQQYQNTTSSIQPKSRETSNLSSSKAPRSSEESGSKSLEDSGSKTAEETIRPPSQQRVTIVDSQATPEPEPHETSQNETALDSSMYEDVLFQPEDVPAADTSTKETDTLDQRVDSKTSADQSTKPSSRKTAPTSPTSYTRSRTSTPNSLEPPDCDTTRTESRAPESAEALLDIRKHDRVVLSRSTIRRNLSRDKRVTFDSLPGVIKVGYKPIDDHCADSTLGGEVAPLVDRFRQDKLKEYFQVKKLFEERGIPMTAKTLDRVLLYPGDRSVHILKKEVGLPLGPLTDQHSPFNQPKPKKKPAKRRRGFVTRMVKASIGRDGGLGAGGGGDGGRAEVDGGGSASSKRSLITVEDVYPPASAVTPKVYKENLSSGRALISRKVDNWMTFEEYSKYTEHLPNRFQHFNRPSNPDTIWPGYLLDKVRLAMPSLHEEARMDGRGHMIKNRDSRAYEGLGTGLYNGMGSAVFQATAQKKMAYPGYNNDLLTWPVGPNGVQYGNIDEHRLIR